MVNEELKKELEKIDLKYKEKLRKFHLKFFTVISILAFFILILILGAFYTYY